MGCYTPIYLDDPERGENEKRAVPCGKCIGCLNKRRNDWVFRLQQENKDSTSSTFLTLTYNNKNLPINEKGTPELKPKDLQTYFKRVRKKSGKKKIKYYSVGEYGEENERPHYHAIVFNADTEVLHEKWENDNGRMGFVSCDKVEEASIRYVTKYVINQNDEKYNDLIKPFARMSKNIGMGYIKRTKNYHRQRQQLYVTKPGGIKQGMPRYYVERIFSRFEQKLMQEVQKDEIQLQDEETLAEDYLSEYKYRKTVTKNKCKSKKC